jgi:phosphatidylserine decarboxylase
MRFAREGYPFIAAGLVLSGAAWVASWAVGDAGGWMAPALAGILSALTLFVVWFFRDPDHALPADAAAVLAPGQGRVVVVGEVDEPTFLKGPCRKISIFLSIFDVHVQRAPVTGTVMQRTYKPGRYAVAWLDKASDDNEQASLGLLTAHGPVLVRQIAGLVARRIVTDPREGDVVLRGDRIGLIRFGSRVDLFLPLAWDVTCKVGDRVVAGLTILARQPSGRGRTPSPAGAGADTREGT